MFAALIMLAADPARIPAPPVKPPVVIIQSAPKHVAPKPVPTTTTTTTVAHKATPTVLEAATAMVGATPTYSADGFWCYLFVEDVLYKAGDHRWAATPVATDGPAALFRTLNPVTVPQPGDVVAIDEDPAHSHGQIMHVAIIESVTADGVNVIQGNGDDASTHAVARGFWPTANVVGYGR